MQQIVEITPELSLICYQLELDTHQNNVVSQLFSREDWSRDKQFQLHKNFVMSYKRDEHIPLQKGQTHAGIEILFLK